MKVDRYYLEINSLENLNKFKSPNKNLILEKVNPPNIELNKFFYKNVGKNHRWIDRLIWDNLKWISYLENKNVHTYKLKLKSAGLRSSNFIFFDGRVVSINSFKELISK